MIAGRNAAEEQLREGLSKWGMENYEGAARIWGEFCRERDALTSEERQAGAKADEVRAELTGYDESALRAELDELRRTAADSSAGNNFENVNIIEAKREYDFIVKATAAMTERAHELELQQAELLSDSWVDVA